MTALADKRGRRVEPLKNIDLVLASGQKAYQGAQIFQNPADGKAYIGGVATGYIFRGTAIRTVDATSADTTIPVELIEEIEIEWWPNATSTDACSATDIGKDAYSKDDQTAAITGVSKSFIGRIWAVDTTKGVAVERKNFRATLGAQPTTASYTANDWAPASVENGATYDVPATGAASTITLPATAPDGTRVFFAADGTKNAHTVQYRDGTGPTNITAALTAAKRHLVVAQKLRGVWTAASGVSP